MIRSVVDENGFFLKNTTPRPSGANLDDCRDADHVFAGAASAVPPRRRLCAALRLGGFASENQSRLRYPRLAPTAEWARCQAKSPRE
jgi:hypothetical protein